MVVWLYLILFTVVHAANYKFTWTNEEWVQSNGGKGQYVSIGSEPIVVQWCIPAGKTLTISEAGEFPDFGITTSVYTEYVYVFPVGSGQDLTVYTDGIDPLVLYRQTNPPSYTAINAVCPTDPGYLYSYRNWKRKFSRLRGRGVGRRLLSTNEIQEIELHTNVWGEPYLNKHQKYLEINGDVDLSIDLSSVHETYPHNLLNPAGDVHKELTPGETHIIQSPISPGNYTLESPNVWTDYIKPVLHVRRHLEEWGTVKHEKLKTDDNVIDCEGEWSIWSVCKGGNGGLRTRHYHIETPAGYGGKKCIYEEGNGEEKACIVTGPAFSNTMSDGAIDKYGKKTTLITFTIRTNDNEKIQCAGLTSDQQPSVHNILNSENMIEFETKAKQLTSQAVKGLTEGTEYNIYCAVEEAVSLGLQEQTPQTFNLVDMEVSNVTINSATCQASWTKYTDTKCVVYPSKSHMCTWDDIKTFSGVFAQQSRYSKAFEDVVYNFKNLESNKTYTCCCSSYDGMDASKAIDFTTLEPEPEEIIYVSKGFTTLEVTDEDRSSLTIAVELDLEDGSTNVLCAIYSHSNDTAKKPTCSNDCDCLKTKNYISCSEVFEISKNQTKNIHFSGLSGKTDYDIMCTSDIGVHKTLNKLQMKHRLGANYGMPTYWDYDGIDTDVDVQVVSIGIKNIKIKVKYNSEVITRIENGASVGTVPLRTHWPFSCFQYVQPFMSDTNMAEGTTSGTVGQEGDRFGIVKGGVDMSSVGLGQWYGCMDNDGEFCLVGGQQQQTKWDWPSGINTSTTSWEETNDCTGLLNDWCYHEIKLWILPTSNSRGFTDADSGDNLLCGNFGRGSLPYQDDDEGPNSFVWNYIPVWMRPTWQTGDITVANDDETSIDFQVTFAARLKTKSILPGGTTYYDVGCVLYERDITAPGKVHNYDESNHWDALGGVASKHNLNCIGNDCDGTWNNLTPSTDYDIYCGYHADDPFLGNITFWSNPKQFSTAGPQIISPLTEGTFDIDDGRHLSAQNTFVHDFNAIYSELGTMHCIADDDSTTDNTPTATQIKAQQNAEDSQALLYSGNGIVMASPSAYGTGGDYYYSFEVTMDECRKYDIWCVWENDDGTVQMVTEEDFTSHCKSITSAAWLTTPYTWLSDGSNLLTGPVPDALTSAAVTVEFDTAGTITCVVTPQNRDVYNYNGDSSWTYPDPPSLDEILNPPVSQLMSYTVSGVRTLTHTFTGLTPGTDYDVYCAQGPDITTYTPQRQELISSFEFTTMDEAVVTDLTFADGYITTSRTISMSDYADQVTGLGSGNAPSLDTIVLKVEFSSPGTVQCVLQNHGFPAPSAANVLALTYGVGGSKVVDPSTKPNYFTSDYSNPSSVVTTDSTILVTTQFDNLVEGMAYDAYCAQDSLISKLVFVMPSKQIAQALALAAENSVLCTIGVDSPCVANQIKEPPEAANEVSVTVGYSHPGKIRCAAIKTGSQDPTSSEIQSGLTLAAGESSPYAELGVDYLKVTFDGLHENTEYDFICTQDSVDVLENFQLERKTKITYWTVARQFSSPPVMDSIGYYGGVVKLTPTHTDDGRCVIIPNGISTHYFCMQGEGLNVSPIQTFTAGQEATIDMPFGLSPDTDYKLYCCQGASLISIVHQFTTAAIVMVEEDTQVIGIDTTEAYVTYNLAGYTGSSQGCGIWPAGTKNNYVYSDISSGLSGVIQSSTSLVNGPNTTDTFLITNSGASDIRGLFINGVYAPILNVNQNYPYSFIVIVPDLELSILSENDCPGCDSIPNGDSFSIANDYDANINFGISAGNPYAWTPETSGTYYLLSKNPADETRAHIAKIIVNAHAPAMPTPTCEYPIFLQNGTYPAKLADCAQPRTVKWYPSYNQEFDIVNPYIDETTLEPATLTTYGYPSKETYNSFGVPGPQITTGTLIKFTGLSSNTVYDAQCSSAGVVTSKITFRTLGPIGGSTTITYPDGSDASANDLRLPEPLGEMKLESTDAVKIVYTMDGSTPSCSQASNFIPGTTGLTSRISDGQTLKFAACGEAGIGSVQERTFTVQCDMDYNAIAAPGFRTDSRWVLTTYAPAWMPRNADGSDLKCAWIDPNTNRYITPCADGSIPSTQTFDEVTCATTFPDGTWARTNGECDDGGPGSYYYDCPLGTDGDDCPAREIDGFCDNGCKIRCIGCPFVESPLPFCGQNLDGSHIGYECPWENTDADENGICPDGCPRTCAKCTDVDVNSPLPSCGVAGYIDNYDQVEWTRCPEGRGVSEQGDVCENTCEFKYDGICDEPEGEGNCADGTDCGDCGSSYIINDFCPGGCLPSCVPCEETLPAKACTGRGKPCPADVSIFYMWDDTTVPLCPDSCHAKCFKCSVDNSALPGKLPLCNGDEPCATFGVNSSVFEYTCDGQPYDDTKTCFKRYQCSENECPVECTNCPVVLTNYAEAPTCRQLPSEYREYPCNEGSMDIREPDCFVNGVKNPDLLYPCIDPDESFPGTVQGQIDAKLARFYRQRCESSGCQTLCAACTDIPDPYPSCENDKRGENYINQCLDGSSATECFEGGPEPCLYNGPLVCDDGCATRCARCPMTTYDSICTTGQEPCPSAEVEIWDSASETVTSTVANEDLNFLTASSGTAFCPDGCRTKCFHCEAQPDPLPKCGDPVLPTTALPCPEDEFDRPTNPSNPAGALCTRTNCPVLCEECLPVDYNAWPKCGIGEHPCDGNDTLALCADGSENINNGCDDGEYPICTDGCLPFCDHCDDVSDDENLLPKCGQYNDGTHVRQPCKDNSTSVMDDSIGRWRCSDNCLESCVLCPDLETYPKLKCGKNLDNSEVLELCNDGTTRPGLDVEGNCADGCATKCELCDNVIDPLPFCGQFPNGTHLRERCEDGSQVDSNNICADTCRPSCDFCADITLPLPKCGRNTDGTQKDFECSDNNPVNVDGVCSDGCAPLCEPCTDILPEYIICEPNEASCDDNSSPVCTLTSGSQSPVIWQSSQLEGVTVCPEVSHPHPRCNDLCTPTCIPATCDACDASNSFLRVENYDHHVNGYPVSQIIQTNGVPIHPMEPYPEGGWNAGTSITDIIDISGYTATDFAAAQSGTCPFCTKFELPKYAEKGTQFWQLESDIDVGISTFTGAYLYNHYHGSDDVAVVQNGQHLDFCSGYATDDCVYHYHAYPSCVQSYVGNCGLIGYLYDGIPVLSQCELNGFELESCYVLNQGESGTKTSHYTYDSTAGDCNLDMANGYTFSSEDISWLQDRGVMLSMVKNFNGYAYVMTKNYPWMMPGFYGTQWGGHGCPQSFTNDWTPQDACVQVSPLCVPLVTRTPGECDCSVDATWCVETGFDTAVQYYNRRPPIVYSVRFVSPSIIINNDVDLQVIVQVSKPIVKAKSKLVLNWENEDDLYQLMEYEYSSETTLDDGVTKQYIYEIPGSSLTNTPIDTYKMLTINSLSAVEDDNGEKSSFSSPTEFRYENSCLPDYTLDSYVIDSCLGAGGGTLTISECNVECMPGGYKFANESVSKICRVNDGTFEFSGCSERCILPSMVKGYDISGCDTTSGGLTADSCVLSCLTADGFVESTAGIQKTCPGEGQVFQLTGCNARCLIDSTIQNWAYDLSGCTADDTGLTGNCDVACNPNYDGNPIVSCTESGQPWELITGECKPQCIAPTIPGYNLEAKATQEKAVLTCAAGYKLSAASNALFPDYSCNGAGLPFVVSGCDKSCTTNFDATIDASGCFADPEIRQDECFLTCATGYSACSGTMCSDPQAICHTSGGVMGQSNTCVPSCSLQNDPDFTVKYDVSQCPGPIYTSDNCDLTCAQGFSSNGPVEVTCDTAGGEIQISNTCSSACSIDIAPVEYDLSNCVIPSGGAITEYECQPTCASGFVEGPNGVKARCSLSTLKFIFSGCSSSNCDNTASISCDDGISCTEDICDPNSILYDNAYASSTAIGCYNIPTNSLCEDSFGCTDNFCTPQDAVADINGCTITFVDSKCDDGVGCTSDVCSPYDNSATSAGCIFTTDNSQCNDNSVCTTDTCVVGVGCQHEPTVCNDGVYCTTDTCDPIQGCIFTPDDNLCIDEWPCTQDVCHATMDCQHTPDNSMCEDEYDCTIDECSLSSNSGADGCSHELDNSVCDDGVDCSENTCAPLSSEDSTGCYNVFNNVMCNDGVACTRDFCSPGHANSTVVGCVNENICGFINPTCTLDLEVDENGMVIKPYVPCVEGKTFASCETVQVTLSERKEEIIKAKKAEIEDYIALMSANPFTVCNPNPCLGDNSTCDIITDNETNATRFNCTCSTGQKGTRCEFLVVSEDTESPANLAFYIILIGCSIIGGFTAFDLLSTFLVDRKDEVVTSQLRSSLLNNKPQRRRVVKKNRYNY